MDIDHLRRWIGRSETAEDSASAAPLAGLAALLDHEVPPWIESEVPPLGHWLYFLDHARQSELGPDGHARRGGFLPPVELPRRMWAGSRIRFAAPLAVGAAIRRVSTIANVEAKTGRSGTMVFVTVRHEIFADDAPAIVDEHDIVYREAAKAGGRTAPATPDPRTSEITRTIHPDPVLLFRYSALTFNGHRIHYDHDYCRDVEGYPGLVVHGPLIATLLIDHFLRAHPKVRIAGFAFRAQRPLFSTAPFTLRMAGGQLWACNDAGELAVDATLQCDGD